MGRDSGEGWVLNEARARRYLPFLQGFGRLPYLRRPQRLSYWVLIVLEVRALKVWLPGECREVA
jgi:hypothetical protein